MRLSAELLDSADQRPNPLGEREIILRGLGIPMIENLGVTRDSFDAIDLSNNQLTKLENFPRFQRLNTLICCENAIASIDSKNFASNLKGLETLVLTNNRISSLHVIEGIGSGCGNLRFLSLVGNPVTRRQHYRLYAINKIPSLNSLDFVVVKRSERQKAKRLANSAAGAALDSDIRAETNQSSLTFTPGEGLTTEHSPHRIFNSEEQLQVRRLVENATSPAEIARIESAVKRGEIPDHGNASDKMRKRTSDSSENKLTRDVKKPKTTPS